MTIIRTFNASELTHYCEALTKPNNYNGNPIANQKTIAGYKKYHQQWELSSQQPLFFWSDQHYDHKRIIDYAHRPFDDVHTMNHTMQTHLSHIPENAWVLFGGDVAFNDHGFSQLTCKNSIYIIGNHDMHHGSLHRFLRKHPYVASGVVIDEQYAVCHYPVAFEGLTTIHGHIHQYLVDGMHNMCVEHTQYAPQPLSYFTSTPPHHHRMM